LSGLVTLQAAAAGRIGSGEMNESGGNTSPSRPVPSAVVHVGSYALEVASGEGTFALFDAEKEQKNADALATAFREAEREPESSSDRGALAAFEEDTSAITARCEKCVRLFTDLARGRALDPEGPLR
jgi:hypothetical protein